MVFMKFDLKRMVGMAGTYLATGLAVALLGCSNPNKEALVSEAGETYYTDRNVSDHMMVLAAQEAVGGQNPRKGIVGYVLEECVEGLSKFLFEADKNGDGKLTAKELRNVEGLSYVGENEDDGEPLEEIKAKGKIYLVAPNIVDHLLAGVCSRYSGGKQKLKSGLCNEKTTIGSILFGMARKADTNEDYQVSYEEYSEFKREMEREYAKNPDRKDSVMLIPSLVDVVFDRETKEGYMADVFTKRGINELALRKEYGKLPSDKSIKPNQKILLEIGRCADKDKDKEIGRDEYLAFKRKMIQRR